MNFKKFISGVSALAIAASAFAGMAVTANAEEGDVTNLATVNFDDGTTTGMTNVSGITVENNRIRIRSGSGAITVNDSKIGVTDKVKVSFQLAFGKLSGKTVYFNLKDAEGDVIGSLSCNPYSGGAIDTTLGVTWDYMYRGSNDTLWDRCVNFEITVDYKEKKITTNTSCYMSGSGKAATTGSFVTDLPAAAGALKTFTIGANYNTNDSTANRRCEADNFVIDHIEGPALPTYSVTTNYVDQQGNAVKTPTTTSVIEGSEFTPVYEATFDDDDYRYTYVSNTTIASVTEDASVNVVYSKAALPEHTVTFKAAGAVDKALGTVTVKDNKTASLNFSKYILNGTDLCVTGTSGTNSYYTKSVTNVTADQTVEINYTKDTENVVFYSEGENINGLTPVTSGNAAIRSSNAAAAYAPKDTVICNLDPGKYVVKAALYSPSSAGANLNLELDGKNINFTAGNSNWTNVTSDEITVSNSSDLTFKQGGGTSSAIDFIYVIKTGDVKQDDATEVKAFTFDGITANDVANKTMSIKVGSNDWTAPVALPTSTEFSGDGEVGIAIIISGLPEGLAVSARID